MALHALDALCGEDDAAPAWRRERKALLDRLGVVRLPSPPVARARARVS